MMMTNPKEKRPQKINIKEKCGHVMHQAHTYLRDYRFNSILIRYFLLLLVCLVVPVTALNTLYGNRLQRNMQDEMLVINQSSLTRNQNMMDSMLISMKKLTYTLAGRDNLRYLSTMGDQIGTDTSGNLAGLRETIHSLQSAYDYIDSVYIYFENAGCVITSIGVSTLDTSRDQSWLAFYSSDMPRQPVVQTRCKTESYPYLITMLYPIYTSVNSCIGAVVVNIDAEKLGNFFGTGKYRADEHTSTLLIFNEAMDTLVYTDEYRLLHDEQEQLEELKQYRGRTEPFSEVQTISEKQYAVSGMFSQKDGLLYLYLSPLSEFESRINETSWMLKEITLVSVVLCMLLAVLLAIWVYRPIQRTMRLVDRASLLTAWDKKERLDEIKAIQRTILSAQKENKYLNEEIEERMISLHNAQICALQTQINPHFLYNTLEAIGNAAALLTTENNTVTDMIFTLGQLMRLSLSGENYLVPLSEELEHVKLYVKIMDFRYNGNIHVHLEIPEEILQERMVKLTLQPLIENAIQHGLTQKHCYGDIWLKCGKSNNEIFIYVVDNGVGMDEDQLQALRKRIQTPIVQGTHHIGLRNVNQRLKLVYGDHYGLNINHATEGGLCVTVHFEADVGENAGGNLNQKIGKFAHDGTIVPKDGTGVG